MGSHGFPYPEFHGKSDECVVNFLEQIEMACITNQVVHEDHILKLMKIFLKGDAKNWLKAFEVQEAKQVPHRALTLNRLKEALLEAFQPIEDASVLWKELQELRQGPGQSVDEYVHTLGCLWDCWCISLRDEVPPLFLKKNLFMAGLLPSLQLKVESKKPKSFYDALQIARDKERKLSRIRELSKCANEELVYSSNAHVSLVEANKDAICDVVLSESLRAKQVTRGMYYVPSNFFPMVSKMNPKYNDKKVEEPQDCFMEEKEIKSKDHVERTVVACTDNGYPFEVMGCHDDGKTNLDACVDDKLTCEPLDSMVDGALVANSLHVDYEDAISSNSHSFHVDTWEEGKVETVVLHDGVLSYDYEQVLNQEFAPLNCKEEELPRVECTEGHVCEFEDVEDHLQVSMLGEQDEPCVEDDIHEDYTKGGGDGQPFMEECNEMQVLDLSDVLMKEWFSQVLLSLMMSLAIHQVSQV